MTAMPPMKVPQIPRMWICMRSPERGCRLLSEEMREGRRDNALRPFRQEVAALFDLERRRAAADTRMQRAHHRRAEHGISHADRHEAVAPPVTLQEMPGPSRQFCARCRRMVRHQLREAPRARLVARVGEGCIVGRALTRGQMRTRATEQLAGG